MKKIFKRKDPAAEPQAGLDMASQIDKIQEKLSSLEKKLDILINQSSARPPQEKHFPHSFQRFDRHDRRPEGGQDRGYRERSFTKAICADCHNECEVPFKPTGDRPVYCKECFSKRKSDNPFSRERDDRPPRRNFSQGRRGDKSRDRGIRDSHGKKDYFPRKRKERGSKV